MKNKILINSVIISILGLSNVAYAKNSENCDFLAESVRLAKKEVTRLRNKVRDFEYDARNANSDGVREYIVGSGIRIFEGYLLDAKDEVERAVDEYNTEGCTNSGRLKY